MGRRLEKIKKAVSGKYLVYFLVFASLFIALNIFVNKLNVTLPPMIFQNPKLGISILFFVLLVAGLIALNINLMILKFKEIRGFSKKGSGLTMLGVFGGLLGGACPGCIIGFFPAFLGLLGISATLSILPFYGMEIQAVSAVLLMVSVVYLTKDNVCKDNFCKV
jgi:hypothetical protein